VVLISIDICTVNNLNYGWYDFELSFYFGIMSPVVVRMYLMWWLKAEENVESDDVVEPDKGKKCRI